jgi:hypothetical protein
MRRTFIILGLVTFTSIALDQRNKPGREVCMHFFGMEVTWK